MDDGQTALHQTTTAIWEAMSLPTVAINTQVALRLAREAAVRASEVGTAGDATREHARQVIALMNRVIAEGRALAHEGQEAENHARELAETLDQMEADLGERLAARRYDFGSAPLVRRISGVSDRLRQMLHPDEQRPTAPPPPRTTGRPPYRPDGNGTMGAPGETRTRQPGRPPHDGAGRFPSGSFPGADSLGGFPQPPANPGVSGSRNRGIPGNQGGQGNQGNSGRQGNQGRRPPDGAPPGGLPPLGRFDDEPPPPRGPNDSHWLND